MIPYLRRQAYYREISAQMDHIAARLGLRPAVASDIRNFSLKTIEASDGRRAKRKSWRSEGARRKRNKTLVVRRTVFEDHPATRIEKVFLRRCLIAELGEEQGTNYVMPVEVMAYRYVKHLVFHGLSVKPSGLAATLGALLYGCNTDTISAYYSLVVDNRLGAWSIPQALEVFQASDSTLRQARASARREIIERFRHLGPWKLRPNQLNDSRKFAEAIRSGTREADRYLAQQLARIDRNLLDQACSTPAADLALCNALNEILEDEDVDLDQNEDHRWGLVHRAELLAADYQDRLIKNRRLLEDAYRAYIQYSIELNFGPSGHPKTTPAIVLTEVTEEAELRSLVSFLDVCAPWGIGCDGSTFPASTKYPPLSEEDEEGDAVDKAAADIRHGLMHQECLKEFSKLEGRQCFKNRRPNMWLPTLLIPEGPDGQPPSSGSALPTGQQPQSNQSSKETPSRWRSSLHKWRRQRRTVRSRRLIVMIDCVSRAELDTSDPDRCALELEAASTANFVEVYGVESAQTEPVLLAACILSPGCEIAKQVAVANQRFDFIVKYDDGYKITFSYEVIPQGSFVAGLSAIGAYLYNGFDWFAGLRPIYQGSLIVLFLTVLVGISIRTGMPGSLVARFFPRENTPQQIEVPRSTPSPNLVESPSVKPSPAASVSPAREQPKEVSPLPTPTFKSGPPPEPIVAQLYPSGRAGNPPPVITIPPDLLVFKLNFEEADQFDYVTYDATLFRNNPRRTVGNWHSVLPKVKESQRTLSFPIAAKKLQEGNFTLEVTGRRRNGSKGEKQTLYLNLVNAKTK